MHKRTQRHRHRHPRLAWRIIAAENRKLKFSSSTVAVSNTFSLTPSLTLLHTMGKKKVPVFRDASAKKKNNEDEGASIKAIRTWDDIEHDSEDECTWI